MLTEIMEEEEEEEEEAEEAAVAAGWCRAGVVMAGRAAARILTGYEVALYVR